VAKMPNIMNQEELSDKIDLFVWELLPEEEQASMEKTIRKNPDLRDEVAKRLLRFEVFKQMERDALAEQIAAWDAEEEQATPSVKTVETPQIQPVMPKIEPPTKRLIPLRPAIRWAIAASFALFAFVTWRYYFNKNQYDGMLVANTWKVKSDTSFFPKIINETVGASGIDEELKDSVNTYFINKEFGKSINYLNNLAKNTEGRLVDSTQQRIEWYLVLSYTADKKTSDKEHFSPTLARILQNPQHHFYEEARELKQKMESFWWRWFN
jgi:hypothetical protein